MLVRKFWAPTYSMMTTLIRREQIPLAEREDLSVHVYTLTNDNCVR